MRFEFYIVAKARALKYGPSRNKLTQPGSVRATKGKPALARDEVAIKMHLDLPEGLFNRPTLSARVEVQGDSAPVEITAETLSNIEAVIRDQTHLQVRVVREDEE